MYEDDGRCMLWEAEVKSSADGLADLHVHHRLIGALVSDFRFLFSYLNKYFLIIIYIKYVQTGLFCG